LSVYLTKLLVYDGYVFICSLFLLLIVYALNKKWPNKLFHYCNKIFGVILAVSFFLIVLNLFFSVLAFTVGIVFSIFEKLFFSIFSSSNTAKYLALVLTLITLAYMPEQIGFWVLRIFDLTQKSKNDFAGIYKKFIRFIRPKLWIYLFALVITLLSSIETFLNREIILFAYWVGFKSVVLQSVVTFIAFDRFLKMLLDEWTGIKKDVTDIYKSFSETKEIKKEGL